jgi:glucokinase
MGHILIADNGGSNARYAQLVGRTGCIGHNYEIVIPIKLNVDKFPTLIESAQQYVKTYGIGETEYAIIAAAGPVLDVGGHLQVKFKNSPWICDQRQIADALGIPLDHVFVINDFQAASYAINTLNPEMDFLRVQDVQASPQSPARSFGPGTGLGVGLLTPDEKGVMAWAAEPQHAAAIAVNERQGKLIEALRKIYPRKYWFSNEDLYCFGRGLGNLHAAARLLAGQ